MVLIQHSLLGSCFPEEQLVLAQLVQSGAGGWALGVQIRRFLCSISARVRKVPWKRVQERGSGLSGRAAVGSGADVQG